ncbi:MAG: hypothetical protein WKF97_07810 [Chitinophagaceae bacterium]
MKRSVRFSPLIPIIVLFAISIGFKHPGSRAATPLNGAWEWQDTTGEHLLIFTDSYYTNTAYSKSNKHFIHSYGGVYRVQANQLTTTIEYHTQLKDQVGQTQQLNYAIEDDKLMVSGIAVSAKRLDDGSGQLAGTWRIFGRMQEGKMSTIEGGPRKTLKILSGTRFQWVAINPEAREFFGTGGGAYAFVNGKYTETIDFFSRDSSRVGISLSFDGRVENDQWHHSGQSSKGEDIHEIWSKVGE